MKNLIKNTFLDIYLLFKNFIHWNFSKIIILMISLLLGMASVLPLLLIYFIFTGFSFTEVSILVNSIVKSGQMLPSIFANVIYILCVLAFIIGYYYSYILLIKLNKSYIDGEKIGYKENFYFNYKIFLKYFALTILFLVILMIPIIVFGILSLVIVGLMGGVADVTSIVMGGPNNIFTILFAIFFITIVILTPYLGYRFIFSYFLLVEDKNKDTGVFGLLKESFFQTKGVKKLLNLIVISLLLVVALLPINVVGGLLSMKKSELDNYIIYSTTDEVGKSQLLSNDSYYYNSLLVKYEGVDLGEAVSSSKMYETYLWIFTIFDFLVVSGLFIMLLTSFYNKNLIKK